MFVILMATYNGEKYIGEQLESIVQQNYEDWKLFISDDGSSDGTIEIINSYVSRYPDKIILKKNESNMHGAKNNFFYAIMNAPVGEYYVLCDQDDVWEKDKLEVIYSDFQKLDDKIPQLIYHELRVVDENLDTISERLSDYAGLNLDLNKAFRQLLLCNYTPGCAITYNEALRKKIIIPGQSVSIHDWWIMIIAACFGEIHRQEKSLAKYRQHTNNTIGIQEDGLKGYIKRIITHNGISDTIARNVRLKTEGYEINKAFFSAYGDQYGAEDKKWLEDNLRDLKCRSRLVAIYRAVKRKNYFSKGVLYNLFYWFVRCKRV